MKDVRYFTEGGGGVLDHSTILESGISRCMAGSFARVGRLNAIFAVVWAGLCSFCQVFSIFKSSSVVCTSMVRWGLESCALCTTNTHRPSANLHHTFVWLNDGLKQV